MSQDDQSNRILQWDACYNVRDIGGYSADNGLQTRRRAITRADNLHRLTPGGQAALRDYGVRTIIDLRLAHELERHPNPFADQQASSDVPRYLNLPLHDPEANAAMDLEESMEGEYIVILERSKPLIAAVMQAVAEALEEGGVVVHCHGGKDRTGIVVALLLSVAGVPRETIIEDYALSEAQLEPVHTAWLEEQSRNQGQPVARPRWMHSRPETLRGVLEFLDREYGGPLGYLEVAGVPPSTMAQIRDRLLEPAVAATP